MELLRSFILCCWLVLVHYYIHNSQNKVKQMDESVGANISNKWGMGGGLMTVLYGWMTDAGTAVFVGIVITLAGFVMSYYFQRKRQIRERAEAALRKELLLREEARKEELHQAQILIITQGRAGNDGS